MWMLISDAVKAGLGAQSSWSRRIKAGHVASKKDDEGKTLVWVKDESKQIMKLLDLVTAQQATIDGLTREAPKPEPKLEVVTVKPMKSKPKAKKNKAQSRKIKRAPRPVSPAKKSSAASDWSKTI